MFFLCLRLLIDHMNLRLTQHFLDINVEIEHVECMTKLSKYNNSSKLKLEKNISTNKSPSAVPS